jgi:hypothetical protein
MAKIDIPMDREISIFFESTRPKENFFENKIKSCVSHNYMKFDLLEILPKCVVWKVFKINAIRSP